MNLSINDLKFGSFYVPTIAQAGGPGECGDENGWGNCGAGGFSAATACRGGATGIRNSWSEGSNDGCGAMTKTWTEYQCDGQGGGTEVRRGTVTIGVPCDPETDYGQP